jgi:hypothetical protein
MGSIIEIVVVVNLFNRHNKTPVNFVHITCVILICYMFQSIEDHHQANTHY